MSLLLRHRGLTIPPDTGIPPAWGDGQSFKNRPYQGTQIQLNGVNNVVIENLYWENRPYVSGQGNAHVCILLNNCTNITVRHCDFDNISEAVAIFGGSNITIEWCRAREIRGPSQPRAGFQTGNFCQTVNSPTNITVQDNKLVVKGPTEGGLGDTEDVISLYSTNTGLIARNQIDGRGWFSPNGTGLILGDGGGTNQVGEDNTLIYPGQVGIAIAGGTGHTLQRNTVYHWMGKGTEYVGNANIGGYIYNFAGFGWGGHAAYNNRVYYWSDIASGNNGWWNPDGFPEAGNNWSDPTIDPNDLEVVL